MIMLDWTEGRIRSFIVSALRTGARRWPPKYITLLDACTGQKVNIKSGRLAKHYTCAHCKEEYPSKDVEVDHISPVVDVETGFIDWNTFIDRLFCPKENLQVLCKVCHRQKTKEERGVRTKSK
jgi:5-methylcytosine-specific restriction endonuclease McrA